MGHVDWERVRSNALAFASNQLTEQPTPVGTALRRFWTDSTTGITSDPLVRTWLPQRPASESWESPLPSLPPGFWPYEFQAKAFDRLSVAGQLPRPTAIAAPEGSGKSECFLLPILDHCARQQGMNRAGIKAVIVYSSRAAATDNAARLGTMCQMFERFNSLRPALLVDEFGGSDSVGPGFIINSIEAMGTEPPDVLLTVPEMLNLTLQSKRHARVWAGTTPVSLRFIVLDDLHFYTDSGIRDLAVLLRRLGARLGMASPSQPLGGAVPVVTAGVSVQPMAVPADQSGDLAGTDSSTDEVVSTQVAEQRSVLPRPKADFRSGGGLPELSTISADDPTRGLAGSLGSSRQADDSGLPPLGGATDGKDRGRASREPNQLLDLAEYLFGVDFSADSLIVDSTMTPDELCPQVNTALPVPALGDLARIPMADPVAVFTELFGREVQIPADQIALGQMLCSHPIIAEMFKATHQQAATVGELAEAMGFGSAPDIATNATRAIQRIASLVGAARRLIGTRAEPLARIDAQLSFSGMTRVMRAVSDRVQFMAPDQVDLIDPSMILPPALGESGTWPSSPTFLPAVACRDCGAAGWLATLLGQEHQRLAAPMPLWAPLGEQTGNLGIVMVIDEHGGPGRDQVTLLDPVTLRLHVPTGDGEPPSPMTPGAGRDALAVGITSGSAAISARTCPVCHHQGTVDFVGSGSRQLLAEVTTDLVGSTDSAGSQRLVVLTGSRETVDQQVTTLAESSYLRALRAHVVAVLAATDESGQVTTLTVPQLADAVLARATTDDQRRELAPPDLLENPSLMSLWGPAPSESDMGVLHQRIEFELVRELGQRSAEASSLVGSGTVSAAVHAMDLGPCVDAVSRTVTSETGLNVSDEQIRAYLNGLLERLRLDGAVDTPLLRQYVTEGGDAAFVTDRRPVGLPELFGSERPHFLTTAAHGGFESITSIHKHPGGARTWLVEWACSALGVNSVDVPPVTRAALESLVGGGAVFAVDSMDGHRVYGLSTSAILATATGLASEPTDAAAGGGQRVRTASTVDVTAIEKARTEWSFKHLPSAEAPNVLYMSAGHIRSDRDVIDTTIDLATVDSLVVEEAALGQMESVPEVRRVGIGSGSGTVVLVSGELDSSTRRAERHGSVRRSLVETSAALPSVPDSVDVTRGDYVDFLFDRVAQGSIDFPVEFETLGQMMAVATSIPDSLVPGPSNPTTGDVSKPKTPGHHESWAQGPTAPSTLPSMPELAFTSTPLAAGKAKPLFEVITTASAAASSLTKATPLEEFRRTVAPIKDAAPKTPTTDRDRTTGTNPADDLEQFAKAGVAQVLQRWHRTFQSVRSAGKDLAGPGTMMISVDDLTNMAWPDGVALLDRFDVDSSGSGPQSPATPGSSASGPDLVAGSDTEARPTAWTAADGRLAVEFPGGEPATLVIRLPILDIQGRIRVNSCAAAIAKVLPRGMSVRSELALLPGTSVRVGQILVGVTGGPTDAVEASAPDDLSSALLRLSQPAHLRETILAAVEGLQNCACREQGRMACRNCLLAAVAVDDDAAHGRFLPDDVPDGLVGPDGSVVFPQLSRALALEVLAPILEGWGTPETVSGPPGSVPGALVEDELARAFELSLRVWLERAADARGELRTDADGIEFSIVFDSQEQVYRVARTYPNGLANSAPMYRIASRDGGWPRVMLMLVPSNASGVGESDQQRIIHEAMVVMRSASQGDDNLTWVLTWSDVAEFYDAVVAAEAADMTDHSLVSGTVRVAAADVVKASAGRVSVESLEQNRYLLLLDVLARPWMADWAGAATALRNASGDTRSGSQITWFIVDELAGAAQDFPGAG